MFDAFNNYSKSVPGQDPNEAVRDVEQVVNQYAGKSEAELLNTLKSMVNTERTAGRLDAARMEMIKNTLLPMMDEAQRKRMEEVLQLL